MPPFRGQGLNHAIQDAYNLAEAVKAVQDDSARQTEVLAAYSNEVVQRGAEETSMSRQNAYMALSYQGFKDSA